MQGLPPTKNQNRRERIRLRMLTDTRLKSLQAETHAVAREKGWYDDDAPTDLSTVVEKLCLIHSEVSEALEVLRGVKSVSDLNPTPSTVPAGSKPIGFGSELADVVIRTLDLASYLGIDLESEVIQKHEYNKSRSYRHGGKTI